MVEIDLSSANLGRVAGQDVDMLMIANQVVWQVPSADGPYYLNDHAPITPNSFNDGTPNIVIGHLVLFHNDGFVTGIRWNDLTAAAGNWILGLWDADTADGRYPDGPATTRIATKTVVSTGAGLRDTTLDTPVAVEVGKVYVVSRYSATGYYAHTTSFSAGSHGAYTDADPVYVPSAGEDLSSINPEWTDAERSLYRIGGGDTYPVNPGISDPFYGISPIFFKSL